MTALVSHGYTQVTLSLVDGGEHRYLILDNSQVDLVKRFLDNLHVAQFISFWPTITEYIGKLPLCVESKLPVVETEVSVERPSLYNSILRYCGRTNCLVAYCQSIV